MRYTVLNPSHKAFCEISNAAFVFQRPFEERSKQDRKKIDIYIKK